MTHSNHKLLTIAIPTYNRCDDLVCLLHQIYKTDLHEVEVLVSDNGSIDKTLELCQAFVCHQNFRLVRNYSNKGFDSNIKSLLEHVASTYVWFISDDYRVSVDLIQKIISLCRKNTYSSILIDAKVVKKSSPDAVIISSLGNGDTDYRITGLKYIDPGIFRWSTLLSSIVVRYNDLPFKDLELAMGTNFSPLAIFWLVSRNRSVFFLRSIKLTKQDGNISDFGSTDAFVWLNGMICAYSFLSSYGFPQNNIKDSISTIFKPGVFNESGIVVHYLLSKIREQSLTKVKLADVYAVSNQSFLEKVVLKLISLLPPKTLIFLYQLFKKPALVIKSLLFFDQQAF